MRTTRDKYTFEAFCEAAVEGDLWHLNGDVEWARSGFSLAHHKLELVLQAYRSPHSEYFIGIEPPKNPIKLVAGRLYAFTQRDTSDTRYEKFESETVESWFTEVRRYDKPFYEVRELTAEERGE